MPSSQGEKLLSAGCLVNLHDCPEHWIIVALIDRETEALGGQGTQSGNPLGKRFRPKPDSTLSGALPWEYLILLHLAGPGLGLD